MVFQLSAFSKAQPMQTLHKHFSGLHAEAILGRCRLESATSLDLWRCTVPIALVAGCIITFLHIAVAAGGELCC